MTVARRFRRGTRAISVVLAVAFSAASAPAMTPQDCTRIRDALSEAIPAVAELRLSPSLTDDGWCRVVDGPLGAGLEWRADAVGDRFSAQFRQRAFEIEDLGRFELEGTVDHADGRLTVGPIRLARSGEAANLNASIGAPETGGNFSYDLQGASLSVTSGAKFASDILAWAFRLDAAAARSNFTAARDQREDMLKWLEDLPATVTDAESRENFRKLVAAYPNARGIAVLSAGADGPVQFGELLAAVLRGSDFTRADGAALLGKAGLRLSWEPR